MVYLCELYYRNKIWYLQSFMNFSNYRQITEDFFNHTARNFCVTHSLKIKEGYIFYQFFSTI